MPIHTILEYLRSEDAQYTTLSHPPAYTAQEVAQAAHIHGYNLAKVVVINADGRLSMVVLPSHYHVALDNLRDAIGAKDVRLATEAEFAECFPGCQVGAIPPFGHLFGMPLYMDANTLTGGYAPDEEIAFSAGSHSELIRMKFSEFERLARPTGITSGVSPAGMSPPRNVRERKGIRM